MSNSDARQAALAKRDAFDFEPTRLVSYRSRGKLLAIGDEAALGRCDDLPATVEIEKISAGAGPIRIEGYLGAYTVITADANGNTLNRKGDAILDLNETALLTHQVPPPGYLHAPRADWARRGLLGELENLAGEFEKPEYIDYDASICAHQANGKAVCRQCLDACPAEAIRSLGEIIEVDAYLCQGGGVCSTVCPSGALRYLYPNLRDSGKRLRDMLAAYRENDGTDPVVLFHAQSYSPASYLEAYDNLLPLQVEELASVGMDLCLAALAYGAAQVVLLVDEQAPKGARDVLRQQLDWLHVTIGELGLGSAHVATCEADAALPEVDTACRLTASRLDMPPGKRNAIFQALDHLAGELQPGAAAVDLPPSAPFGEVSINGASCTLCMACIGSCAGRALQDGSNREVPELFFIESNCLQCGACVQTCPEAAISLKPRLLFDREARNRARMLNSDTPFACISCDKPFAPTSAIHKMQEKLKDHPMFNNQRALDRLKMCDDCRVIDMVQDPQAMSGQFDPLKE